MSSCYLWNLSLCNIVIYSRLKLFVIGMLSEINTNLWIVVDRESLINN